MRIFFSRNRALFLIFKKGRDGLPHSSPTCASVVMGLGNSEDLKDSKLMWLIVLKIFPFVLYFRETWQCFKYQLWRLLNTRTSWPTILWILVVSRLIEFYLSNNPTGTYMFKVNKRKTRTRCGICTTSPCSSVSIVNFDQVNAG